MTIPVDAGGGKADSNLAGAQDESELIAQEYEEEAAIGDGAADVQALATRIRRIEERLATVEDYLGRPNSNDTLEDRLEQLETRPRSR